MSESREAVAGSHAVRGLAAAFLLLLATAASAQVEPATAVESVTFDEAVQRAIVRRPTVGEAAQSIVRAQGLLDPYGPVKQLLLEPLQLATPSPD